MQNTPNKQEKRTTTDTSNECQYICLYNIRTMKLLSESLVSFGMSCLSWGLDLRL